MYPVHVHRPLLPLFALEARSLVSMPCQSLYVVPQNKNMFGHPPEGVVVELHCCQVIENFFRGVQPALATTAWIKQTRYRCDCEQTAEHNQNICIQLRRLKVRQVL